MTPEVANDIYNILVEECGAPESMRENFVYSQTNEFIKEWRFQGRLRFGGKFWRRRDDSQWDVNYYPEDQTAERDAMQARANERLADLREQQI